MEALSLEEEKANRRKVVNADNNIDLILAGRAKKHSVPIPSVETLPSKRLRRLIMAEKDFNHLVGEVTGEKYDNPCRPELEYLVTGYEKDSNITEHVAMLYDDAKSLFIMSKKCEDLLLYRTRQRNVEKFIILSSVSKVGKLQYNCLDSTRQRLFRRFLREFISPLLKDVERVSEAVERITSRFYEHQEGVESDSESSKESEKEQEEVVAVGPKKKPAKRVSKLVRGGARSTTVTRDSMKASPSRAGSVSTAAAGTRRTISSFSKKT